MKTRKARLLKKVIHGEGGVGKGQENAYKRNDFAPNFDHTNMVLAKIKELRMRSKKPVSVAALSAEFGTRIPKNDLVETLRHLNEMAEIRQVPGPELSYDLY